MRQGGDLPAAWAVGMRSWQTSPRGSRGCSTGRPWTSCRPVSSLPSIPQANLQHREGSKSEPYRYDTSRRRSSKGATPRAQSCLPGAAGLARLASDTCLSDPAPQRATVQATARPRQLLCAKKSKFMTKYAFSVIERPCVTCSTHAIYGRKSVARPTHTTVRCVRPLGAPHKPRRLSRSLTNRSRTDFQ